MRESIKVFAPATVANVGCGYDVLGFALEGYGDELILTRRHDDQLVIASIEGVQGLPLAPEKNVSTVAIKTLLADLDLKQGFDLRIKKNIAAGSGLGSSASSAAAAVYAANEMLGRPKSQLELINYAMAGEKLASTKAHADNVAPSILGGFTAVRSYEPLDVFNISYPESLKVVIIFPQIEIKTSDAKKILKDEVKLTDAVKQWGNMAGLVSGLIEHDFERIGKSLQDVIVEPVRSILIPFYHQMKTLALKKGALGFSISGSGPSMFCFMKEASASGEIIEAAQVLYGAHEIGVVSFVSGINKQGAKIIE
ncbi:homoserine kinase [Cyclobacteriaceae bacterium]|jgi:homoserine kinase|nr:homoserine kinase [Cyclobacteriaceae bacterium]|tara:strand:- start:358 stop:1287 length:930 start_codon:yes stop_codon:yes gene_type:complete